MAIRRWTTVQRGVQQLSDYLAGRRHERLRESRFGERQEGALWGDAHAEARTLGWDTARAGFGGSLFGSEVGDAFGAFGIDDGFEMGGSPARGWSHDDSES